MCRKASQRKLEVVNSNALDLSFKSSTFDAMIFCFSIEIIPEVLIKPVLDESFRVLGQGGAICFICMADVPNKKLISRLYSWAHKEFPEVVDCRPISISLFLDENRFMIIHREIRALYGLPVEIIMAEKKYRRK
jgi:demethylmenaquinone methyltransferase/2-methoxy-6-polyprenyl-1,4-benzoquinol methylase